MLCGRRGGEGEGIPSMRPCALGIYGDLSRRLLMRILLARKHIIGFIVRSFHTGGCNP